MKIVFVNDDLHVGVDPHKLSLYKNTWYVMSDTDIAQFKNLAPEKIGDITDFKEAYRPYNGEDLNGKTLLTLRSGGIGDLLFMTPAFKHIKEKYKDCKIMAAAGFSYKDVLFNNPHIDELYSMPFSTRILDMADYHLMFEGLIENNVLAQSINAYDLFTEAFKIKSSELTREEKQPIIVLKDEETDGAQDFLIKHLGTKKLLVGMQIETSTERRTFPHEKTIRLMKVLFEEDFNIVVFGGMRQRPLAESFSMELKKFHEDKRVVFLPLTNLTLRHNIAIASLVDIHINPDSAFVHIAAAFNIPQIGIYGPFPSKVRMFHFSNAIGLNAEVACAPCFKHGYWACEKGFPSPCFSVIDVDAILEAMDFLLNWHGMKRLKYGDDKWRKFNSNKALEKFQMYTGGNKKGIDIGCGHYKQEFMKRVDINPFTLPDILANIEGWKDEEQYDFVFSSYCLNEVKDKEAALKNMFDMTKPTGYLLLYLPYNNNDIPFTPDLTPEILTELIEGLPTGKKYVINNYEDSYSAVISKDGL